ncbi:MAG TPA: hypothetical protein VKO42_05495 [Patescibacteria group bacterium]|nr:hypothetical protein [Patescibacteria group bacterium]
MPDKNKQETNWSGETETLEDILKKKPQEGSSWEQEQNLEQQEQKGSKAETTPSQEEEKIPETEEEQTHAASSVPAGVDEERRQQIEKILEKDLVDAYLELEPEKQKQFKQKGEETARRINEMLKKAKIKTKNIIGLIKKWLAFLPKVNKFFLEQEAKKKAEEIIKLKKQ